MYSKSLIVLAAVLAACSRDAGPANAQTAGRTGNDDLPAVLATVDGKPITLDDVRERRGEELGKLEIQFKRNRHRLVETTLQEIIRERLLAEEARKQGKSIEQLIEAAAGTTLYPTEAEVATWYEENRERVRGRPLDDVRPQIAEFLRNQRRNTAIAVLEAQFIRDKKLVINLEPFRIPFDNSRAPVKGRRNAPVTLVEFADFQCPYCAQFNTTLQRLSDRFGDRLAIVYRHFPLTSIHPYALKAGEAAMCAHEQGKFWELHDLMYEEQRKLAVEDIKEKAARLKLDTAAFNSCLDSGRHADLINSDFREGTLAGVNGTPAVFVNGQPIEGGAATFETIAAVIEKELALKN